MLDTYPPSRNEVDYPPTFCVETQTQWDSVEPQRHDNNE
jgi:hypothetical protein